MTNDKEILPFDDSLLEQYDFTNAALQKLRFKFAKVPEFSKKSDEGYIQCKESIAQLRKGWVTTDKKRAELNKDLIAQQRLNNEVGRDICETLKEIAAPWVEAKKHVDEEAARIAEEKRLAEEQRIQVIEDKIADIARVGNYMAGETSEKLQNRLESLDLIVIDELYGEFQDAAQAKLDSVRGALKEAVEKTKAHEKTVRENLAMEEKLKAQQEEMAKREAALKAQEEEQQKKLDEQAARIAENERKLEEAAEAERQKKFEKDVEELNKKQEEELKARLPEDQKLRAWADDLVAVEAPDVKDAHSLALIRSVGLELSDIKTYIYDHTQAPTKKAAKKKKVA